MCGDYHSSTPMAQKPRWSTPRKWRIIPSSSGFSLLHSWTYLRKGQDIPIGACISPMSAADLQQPFPITAAELTGNFCETLTYGMYLVTCTFCARTLFLTGGGQEESWRRLHKIRWLMTLVAFALLSLCTFDVEIGLLHNFRAFIDAEDAETEFSNISDWINIA
ncbi:hypothetical protein D9756_010198 [Leucocoprinus leucothites]|uniref:Uncharacterized protein n=1 Tax=Leucocoprinus leucothites TaxID=201217 RepID=A0A8H5CTY2_9AGAR|nr:hypothetical protein D9756_010198 [Leucoagaricus leucothites]